MDENTGRTPHPEDPAEGATDVDGSTHSGDPAANPEHNTAPDGTSGEGSTDDAIQGDDAPLGGDDTTERQLESDNAVEDDTLRSLDPDAPPA